MMLFLACNDVFRTCTPPEEYFDYGLWIPPEEAAQKMGSMMISARTQSHIMQTMTDAEEAEALPPQPKAVVDQKKKDFEEKFSGGKAPVKQIAQAANEEGFAPSLAELKALHDKHGDNVTYEQFEDFKRQSRHSDDNPEELSLFFKNYDTRGDGSLSRKQVKNLMMNFGEEMTEEEAETVLNELGFNGDRVDYRQLVESVMS